MTAVLNDPFTPPTTPPTTGRLADIPFASSAQDDLIGADGELLAAVAAAYYEPHTVAPTSATSSQRWYSRGTLCLVVDDDGTVVRVIEQEALDNVTLPAASSTASSTAARPVGRRIRGHKGGANLPTDAAEFRARCEAAGLTVEKTATGTHWKITDPTGKRTESVTISSSVSPAAIAENVGYVRRRLGVDVRKWSRSGPVNRAERRKKGVEVTDPPKLVIAGGPSRREAAGRPWVRDDAPETTTEGGPAEPTESTDETLETLLRMARTAVQADGNMPLAEKNARIFAYINAARAADQIDTVSAGKIGLTAQTLAARMSAARTAGDPNVPARLKTMDQTWRERRKAAGKPVKSAHSAHKDKKKTTHPGKPVRRAASTGQFATRPETAEMVERWLTEKGEPEVDAEQPTEPEQVHDEPELLTDDDVAALTEDTALTEATAPGGTLDDVRADLRALRVQLDARALSESLLTSPPATPTPMGLLLGALREAGVQVEHGQLRMAQMILDDCGWKLRMEGRTG